MPSRIPSLGPRGEGWFALQMLLIVAILGVGILARGSVDGAISVVLLVVGAVLIACGLAVAVLAIRNLDLSLSPLPKPTESGVLIVHGLYRYVRHPIYAGLIAAAAGWSLLMASWPALLLTAVLVVVLDLKSRREEGWLRERYPGYAEYATRTSRLLPGVY